MSGHQVLVEVKNDNDLKTIPIVVLTTSDAPADISASYTSHANAFVTKPLDLDGFEKAVQLISRFYRDIAVLPHR